MTNPVFNSIRELGVLIRDGDLSPVYLTEFFLERLENIGPKYNAVVTVTKERAIKQAKRAESEIDKGHYRGPLHGIPYGAKDLLATSGGIPTTWGAAPFKNQIFNYDATLIKMLEKAGAVLTSKLAMVELAGGMGYRQPNASFTGPGKNPWNTETWTGGSSSGSGAAVAAGLVPFAIGSETWGSILSPANNCGVSGLRPTYGRVSRFGAMALSWTLDKLGPLCLTADDCGLVLDAIAGQDPNDMTTADKDYVYYFDESENDFKLAMLTDVLEGCDSDIKDNFESSLNVLEDFASIKEIEFPGLPYEEVTRTILNGEASSAFDDFTEKGMARELTAPECHFGPYARTAVLAKDYLRALRLRGVICRVVDEVMEEFDAVIAPSRRSPASPIDQEFRKTVPGSVRDIMGAVGNGAGLPSISVPNGFTSEELPTGIQFMGRPYEENKIIAIARRYQSKTNWHKKHPKHLLT
jgi:aspartyl-tRNA(Asn)/glutamyl-tRNA(Gln) amidotransferase subunit A